MERSTKVCPSSPCDCKPKLWLSKATSRVRWKTASRGIIKCSFSSSVSWELLAYRASRPSTPFCLPGLLLSSTLLLLLAPILHTICIVYPKLFPSKRSKSFWFSENPLITLIALKSSSIVTDLVTHVRVLFSFSLFLQERRRLSLKYPRTVFLAEDEREVRRIIMLFESLQSLPDRTEDDTIVASCNETRTAVNDRRCQSSPAGNAGPSTSASSSSPSSRGGGGGGGGGGSGGGPFGDLAPGRSPILRRRTLPSPTKTVRGAKTIWH